MMGKNNISAATTEKLRTIAEGNKQNSINLSNMIKQSKKKFENK